MRNIQKVTCESNTLEKECSRKKKEIGFIYVLLSVIFCSFFGFSYISFVQQCQMQYSLIMEMNLKVSHLEMFPIQIFPFSLLMLNILRVDLPIHQKHLHFFWKSRKIPKSVDKSSNLTQLTAEQKSVLYRISKFQAHFS